MTSPEYIASAPGVDAGALKQAFLRGAGLAEGAITADFTPELMEMLGKIVAASLQGTIDLLALRSLVKREVHADVTAVLVRNNNPLKFFPDSQTVLTQMLRKKMPGFMEPLEALADARSDLHAHQLGLHAGTRAGMHAALDQLRADQVEAALAPPGLADTLLPQRRRLALLDEYRRRHASVSAGADDYLFGAAFLAAYDQAVEQARGAA